MQLNAFYKNAGSLRLLSILLLACMFCGINTAFSQPISLTVKNEPLDQVFSQIQQHTLYRFVYTSEEIKKAGRISFSVDQASIEDVLALCFKGQPLDYSVDNHFVVVRQKARDSALKKPVTTDVSGNVVDENGEPLSGTTVNLKGTIRTVETDEQGAFFFQELPARSALVFSHVGYEEKQVVPGKETRITIHLIKLVNKLDEVQVIAYGTTTRKLSTGSVSTVKSETIEQQPVSNPLAALEGRVPGLVVTQQTGVTGGNFSVQLRGQNSISSGNDPLYIIDGVPYISSSLSFGLTANGVLPAGVSPLNSINPDDIESISVLKDADATSIYGSRGANGVILITTKKGKAGKTKLDLKATSGEGTVSRHYNVLNKQQYLQMRHEAFANDGVAPSPYDYDITSWDTTRYTDWQKALIGRTAHTLNAEAAVSGGTMTTQFLLRSGYYRESTVMPGDGSYKKVSTHFNLNHVSLDERFRLFLSVGYYTDNNDIANRDLTSLAVGLPPDAPALYDSSGKINWEHSTWNNPLAFLNQHYQAQTLNLISSAVLGYRIARGLELKVNSGYTDLSSTTIATSPFNSYNPAYTQYIKSEADFSTGHNTTWIVEPQLTLDRSWGPGRFSGLVGMSFQEQKKQGLAQYASDFASDALLTDIQAAGTVRVTQNDYTLYHYAALFGRLNYNILDRYIINVTGRRDGSSRFGPGKQFANFSSAGAAWIFSNEKILKQNPVLSYGKFRTSYGITGNDQIGDYQFLNTYTPGGLYQGVSGLNPSRLYNPDFKWETNRKLEFGIDLGFFRNRLLIGLDYYHNHSDNQLVGYALPPTTGFTTIQSNLPALVENTGVELEITAVNIKTKDFSWSSSVNLTIPRNKLLAFPNLAGSSYASTYVIGQPLTIKKVFHSTGVDPATGAYQFLDADKDGSITFNDRQTAVFVGKKYYGGFQNSFHFRNFQLDVLFQFVKQTGSNYLTDVFSDFTPGQASNQPLIVLGRWQHPGDHASVQRFNQDYSLYTNYNEASQSDLSVSDASYIRLKTLYLSYQVKNRWASKSGLAIKIFMQGQNLLTFTHYQGLDPETLNNSALPPLRVTTLGLQCIL